MKTGEIGIFSREESDFDHPGAENRTQGDFKKIGRPAGDAAATMHFQPLGRSVQFLQPNLLAIGGFSVVSNQPGPTYMKKGN